MKRLSIAGERIALPKEVAPVLKAYSAAIQEPKLLPKGEFLARRKVRVWFALPEQRDRTTVGSRDYVLHKLIVVGDQTYWVGCELELTPSLGDYEFASIGLIVLVSTVDGAKQPILRAEWERDPHHPPGRHAQPHWHVYMSSADHYARTRLMTHENGEWTSCDEGFLSIDPGDVASTEQRAIGRFHLAMAARWHLAEADPHYQTPDEEGLGRWVKGCLEYVREQLTIIATKRPAQSAF
jgi:hypothetical protein